MNDTTIGTLSIVGQHLNIWFGSFLLIIGDLGCVINLIVFRSKSFDKSSFSIYFLATTCADFFVLNLALLTRILQNGFLLQIFQTYNFRCKLRAYISSLASLLSFSFFTMASIDRFLSTHPQASYRSWSNRYSLAIKLIPCITLFWMIILSHRLILYRIDPRSGICEPKLDFYWWYNSYFEFILTGFIPPITNLVIGCMILRNIRIIVARRPRLIDQKIISLERQGKKSYSRLQKLDNQLTSTLLIQLSVLFISFIPYSSELLYSTLTKNLLKSNIYLSCENVFIQFTRLCSYIFYSTNCYVFLISSPLFRNQIISKFYSKKPSNIINHL